jgi:hypothetical protein
MSRRTGVGFVDLVMAGLLLIVTSCASTPTGPKITQSSVVGKWTLNFQWQGRTPGVLAVVLLPDQTAVIPGGQPGGPSLIVPGTTSVSGAHVTWTFPADNNSTWSGQATSSTSLSGTMVNGTGNSGTWTAQQSGPLITQSGVVGTWTFVFQWQGRTPGQLTIVASADQTAQIPGGQAGGPTTTVAGTSSVSGNLVTWAFPGDNSTWYGIAISSSVLYGDMVSSSGNTGLWYAMK